MFEKPVFIESLYTQPLFTSGSMKYMPADFQKSRLPSQNFIIISLQNQGSENSPSRGLFS